MKISDFFSFVKWPIWTKGSRSLEDACGEEVRSEFNCFKGVSSFRKAFKVVSAGRRFFISDSGLLGWAPENSEIGDAVVLLPGGKVPYVLRWVQKGIKRAGGDEVEVKDNIDCDPGDDCCYCILGDAYVQGIMFGEAYDETKLETITLM